MAVAVSEEQLANSDSSGSTATDDLTIGSGTDRLMLVAHMLEGFGNNETIDTTTFGSETLTEAIYLNDDNGNGSPCLYIGYLLDADIPSGSNTLTLGYSAGNVRGGVVWTLTGVDQTTPTLATDGTSSTTNPAALSLAGGASGDAVFTICGANANQTMTAPTGHTSIDVYGGSQAEAQASYLEMTSGGTQTPDWGFGAGGTRLAQIGVLIQQASAAAADQELLTLLGVG